MFLDITWCENKKCPKRSNCKRNSDRLIGIDIPNYYPSSYAIFTPDKDGECEGYVQLNEESQVEK